MCVQHMRCTVYTIVYIYIYIVLYMVYIQSVYIYIYIYCILYYIVYYIYRCKLYIVYTYMVIKSSCLARHWYAIVFTTYSYANIYIYYNK